MEENGRFSVVSPNSFGVLLAIHTEFPHEIRANGTVCVEDTHSEIGVSLVQCANEKGKSEEALVSKCNTRELSKSEHH